MIGHRTRFRGNNDLPLALNFAGLKMICKESGFQRDINGHFLFNPVGKPSFLQRNAQETSQFILPVQLMCAVVLNPYQRFLAVNAFEVKAVYLVLLSSSLHTEAVAVVVGVAVETAMS